MEQEKRLSFMEKAITILEEENRKNKRRIRELEVAVVEVESKEGMWADKKEELIRRIEVLEKKLDEKDEDKREGVKEEGGQKCEGEKAEGGKKEGEKEEENSRRIMANETREKNLKEKGLIVRKGRGWKKGDDLEKIVKEWIGSKEWDFEVMSDDRRKGWMIFKKKEDKEELWGKRKEIWEEGKIGLDEWLDMEERKDRFILLKKAAKLEEMARKMGVRMVIGKENRFLRIDGRKYGWSREKEELEELKED